MTYNLGSKATKIGPRLRELRKQSGRTLKQLSKEVELSISFLSDIERGRTNPSLETLAKIAKLYGFTLSTILAGVVV